MRECAPKQAQKVSDNEAEPKIIMNEKEGYKRGSTTSEKESQPSKGTGKEKEKMRN